MSNKFAEISLLKPSGRIPKYDLKNMFINEPITLAAQCEA
jgi:hypothetical protein